MTREILDFWDLNSCGFISHAVSDTASVNPKTVGLLGLNWIPCACHLLQLAVSKALHCVGPLLQRHRNLV